MDFMKIKLNLKLVTFSSCNYFRKNNVASIWMRKTLGNEFFSSKELKLSGGLDEIQLPVSEWWSCVLFQETNLQLWLHHRTESRVYALYRKLLETITGSYNVRNFRHLRLKMLTYKKAKIQVQNVYGHTTLNTPVLVRSPKLSNVGPG